jgi:hypothetical protein
MGGLGLVAVTVGEIVHHLAIMNTTLVVNLPEDNTTALGGSHAITTAGVDHLLP